MSDFDYTSQSTSGCSANISGLNLKSRIPDVNVNFPGKGVCVVAVPIPARGRISDTLATFLSPSMTFTPITLSSLKTIKNTVIGNPSAKVQLAQDEVFVQT